MSNLELAVYVANLKMLNDLDEAIRPIEFNRPRNTLSSLILCANCNIHEYYGNIYCCSKLSGLMADHDLEISRLYFGQEFCHNLIPSADDLESAFFFARQMGWDFTYVTGGYLVNADLGKIRANFDRLKDIGGQDCEVVFNDWGVFRILKREYPAFKPVLGRLLNKQTRLALFPNQMTPLPIYLTGTNHTYEELFGPQMEAYADVSMNNPEYYEELLKMGIRSLDMDITVQGLKRPENGWNMSLGIYYPFGVMATGRSCLTAATMDERRAYRMLDTPCPQPCRKYVCSPEINPDELRVFLRGPAMMYFFKEDVEAYFNGMIQYERLIFEPYVPL